MTHKPISPCKDICRYEEMDGEPRCISCFRTYEDLEKWYYMSDEERKVRIRQVKKERKEYERKQQNGQNMEKKS